MTSLVTKEGFEKLKRDREKAKQDLAEAQSRMSDTSESGGGWHENNFFEFLEEQIHHLAGKLQEINEKIKNSKVVKDMTANNSRVGFGSTVEFELNGEREVYKILGEADSDLSKNIISYHSPIGNGLMGKRVGQTAKLDLPGGEVKVTIEKIS